MISKIFLVILGLAFLTMATLTFLTSSQLNSIGFSPKQIEQNFQGYESLHWTFLWISSVVLLIISNVILWTERKGWALWVTFLFFAVFIMVNTWWLTENLANYQAQNNLETGGLLSKNGIFGAIFCIVVGIGIFFNQFITLRMRDKMFEQPSEETEAAETENIAEKPVDESVQE